MIFITRTCGHVDCDITCAVCILVNVNSSDDIQVMIFIETTNHNLQENDFVRSLSIGVQCQCVGMWFVGM